MVDGLDGGMAALRGLAGGLFRVFEEFGVWPDGHNSRASSDGSFWDMVWISAGQLAKVCRFLDQRRSRNDKGFVADEK